MPISCRQRAIKYSEVTFPCTRVKIRDITFHLARYSRFRPAKFITAQAVRDIPVNTWHAAETTRLPPFAIIYSDGLTCPAREERSRSGRSVLGMNTRLGVARGSKTKRNVYEKASDFSSSTKEESTVWTMEVQI